MINKKENEIEKDKLRKYKEVNSPVILGLSLWFYIFVLYFNYSNYPKGFVILFLITGIIFSLKGIFPIKEVFI